MSAHARRLALSGFSIRRSRTAREQSSFARGNAGPACMCMCGFCPPGPYLDLDRAQRVVELNVALHVLLIYYKTHTIHITAGRSKRYALRYYSRVRAFRVLHTQSLLITLGPDPRPARPLAVVTPPGGPPAPPRPCIHRTRAASNTARACSTLPNESPRPQALPALIRVRRRLTLTVDHVESPSGAVPLASE